LRTRGTRSQARPRGTHRARSAEGRDAAPGVVECLGGDLGVGGVMKPACSRLGPARRSRGDDHHAEQRAVL
jgi:hypothetical protein